MAKTIKNEKTSKIMLTIVALLLLTGGIALLGYLLSELPFAGQSIRWIMFLGSFLALIPITAGGVCLARAAKSNRRGRHGDSWLNGAIFGIVLISVGALLLCFNSGAINPAWRPFFISWPMLIMAIGFLSIFKPHTVTGTVIMAIGEFFLIPRLGRVYPESWLGSANFTSTYWPILIIVLGLIIVFSIIFRRKHFNPETSRGSFDRHTRRSGRHNGNFHRDSNELFNERCCDKARDEEEGEQEGMVDYNLIFTGAEQVFLDPVFKGGGINTIFAGMTLDLRKTNLSEGTTYLKIDNIFGGVSILAPDNWNIEIRSSSVFGGFTDNRMKVMHQDDSRRLVIIASCIFGGGEIK